MHKRFHSLKTKLNFNWCNNLKTNVAGKLNTKNSIQLCSRSKRKYLANFSSSFESNDELQEFLWTTQSTWKWWQTYKPERGQLTTERDRNGQINGSHEEISSMYELIFRTNISSLVRTNQRDKMLLLPLRSAL